MKIAKITREEWLDSDNDTRAAADTMADDMDMAEKILNLYDDNDVEMAHMQADNILLSILSKLGYEKTIEAFEGLYKWYA